MTTRRLMLALLLCAGTGAVMAQGAYPGKPIRLVIGFAPGGAADYVARAMNEAFSKGLGQPVIIDNKPGAGSSIAAEIVAKAPADGYTVLIASPSSISVNPALNPKIGYTPSELAPVTKITTSPLVLAVNPATDIRSVADLIAAAKKDPNKLNYATSGNGSAPHLGAALFTQITGAQMTHVPYRGGAPAVQSVIAGDTQLTFGTSPSVLPQASTGRLRALAVSTRERSPLVPDLPGMRGGPARIPHRVLVRRVRAGRHAGGRHPQALRGRDQRHAAAVGQGGARARRHRGVAVEFARAIRRVPQGGQQVLGRAREERQGQGGMT
jgi:tripartite-type tricarboxylate transporter receptor subunit TctC